MAKFRQKLFHVDLNHPPSVESFLREMRSYGGKVYMFSKAENSPTRFAIVMKWREK